MLDDLVRHRGSGLVPLINGFAQDVASSGSGEIVLL